MDDHIRTTTAAKNRICSRNELSSCLQLPASLIGSVVANPASFYTEFSIPKANGESRIIRAPRRRLRHLQRHLLLELNRRVCLRPCLHGGIRGRSVLTHCVPHVGRQMVATLDIRKFFPSTTPAHIIPVLRTLGFMDGIIADILGLVTLNAQLPQGAPTSSLLANLAFAPGDSRFIELCRLRHLRYSRYVDDIAISGTRDFAELCGAFTNVIEMAGYGVADEKILFMSHHQRQIVTGLVVNDKLRPTRQFLRQLKADIRACLNHGARLIAESEGLMVRDLKNRLTGRVAHVRHVDAETGMRLRGMLCGVNWRSTVPNAV